MTKTKKRNKKWNPEARYQGKTREEYILLPYQHLIPKKVEEPTEEVEELVEVTD